MLTMTTRDLAPGVDSFDVHLGLWTNWAKGKVYGATLTTTKQDGGLLIAFLALFVAAAGKSFWRISCLVLHRFLSSRELEDALHHQRQAVLRNAETPEFALWNFIVMVKAWRNKTSRPCKRLLMFIIFTIAIFAAYNAASLFSSRVAADTVSEVLLTGNNCRAPWKPDDMDGTTFRQMYDIWGFRQNTANLNYAQKCYMNLDNEENCRHYVKSKIDFQITRNARCPFDEKMCKTGSIIVDTGLLNSNTHLGINLPADSQFQFRSVSQCAPIISEGYTSIHNQTAYPDIPLLRFHYGNYSSPINGTSKDFVYQVATNLSYAYFEGTDLQVRRNARYDVKSVSYHSGDVTKTSGYKTMSLIPELTPPGADISLFFLSAEGLFYLAEINDSWYSAHHVGKTAMSSDSMGADPKPKPVPFYNQDDTASVMGCTSQYQICNPNAKDGPQCHALGGSNDILNRFDEVWGNESEDKRELMEWVYFVFQQGFVSIDAVVDIAGQSALSAAYGLGWSINGPLPDTQWEDEVILWHSASTASLQSLFVDFANGPATLPANISAPPSTAQGRALCTNQRIMSTRYSSFSILGIALIFALGGALTVADLTLESFLDWFQRKSTRHDYARLEWKSNTTLQLQRLAYEEAGSGTWSDCTAMVPTTQTGEKLCAYNITDMMHPRLHMPPTTSTVDAPITGHHPENTCATKIVTRQDSEQTLATKPLARQDSFPSSPPTSPLRCQVVTVRDSQLCHSPTDAEPIEERWGGEQSV